MSGNGTEQSEGWVCSICMDSKIEVFGIYYTHKLKCDHMFHIGCIQRYFLIKNKVWEEPEECVLECPMCRDKTIKMNFGVHIKTDLKNTRFTLVKGDREVGLQITLYGKDLFKRDIKIAKQMLQKVANLCFNVDCYWEVAQMCPIENKTRQYGDSEKNCAKLINLDENEVYIERSFTLKQ